MKWNSFSSVLKRCLNPACLSNCESIMGETPWPDVTRSALYFPARFVAFSAIWWLLAVWFLLPTLSMLFVGFLRIAALHPLLSICSLLLPSLCYVTNRPPPPSRSTPYNKSLPTPFLQHLFPFYYRNVSCPHVHPHSPLHHHHASLLHFFALSDILRSRTAGISFATSACHKCTAKRYHDTPINLISKQH